MKNVIYTTSKALLVTICFCGFFSCSSDDDNSNPPVSNEEYITWDSSGTSFSNGTIFKSLDPLDFGISEDNHDFFLEVETTTPITVGTVYSFGENSTSKLGFDGTGNTDIYFWGGSVQFIEITDTYILGEFNGSNAVEIDDSVSPVVVTPIVLTITNGEFRINR